MNQSLRHLFAFGIMWLALAAGCATDDGEGPGPGGDCETPQLFYPDGDGDGFGADAGAAEHCQAPAGFVARGGDCADGDANVNPDKKEVCDLVDNDCDGTVDDADTNVDLGTAPTFYRDGDGDGFGDADSTKQACAKPSGWSESATDCDDGAAAVNPAAVEVCDYVDNDCDAKVDMADPNIDPASPKAYYRDVDNDNFGVGVAMMACQEPSGYALAANDCNDNDATSYPGGLEVCDGADNDCDGGADGTVAQPNRCTALVGTYSGSYSHLAQEKVGSTVVNSMSCSGTGSGGLQLNRKPGLQGTFSCVYNGGLTRFDQNQTVTLKASVGLDGKVSGTIEHVYDSFDGLKRTYTVTGTQTASSLTLNGTGSFYPHPQSAVPWQVTFSFSTSR